MKIVDRCNPLVRVFVAAAAGASLMSAIVGAAAADENNSGKPVLIFNGGIGVIPVSNVTGCPTSTPPTVPPPCVTNPPTTPAVTVVLNYVRGQQPGGQIWVINQLNAQVFANGSIKVSGEGLVEGGGNSVGGVPAGTNVLADLICQTATTPTVTYSYSMTSSAGVPLSPTGDFQINDNLSPTPPVPCVSPVLLIQSASNHHWFAFGIISSGNSGK
jgi:hypothetical protein